jgi:hypothetical protein
MVTAISRTREAAAIWESPRATAKIFVSAAKKLGLLPTDSERVFERLAERVCEIKDRTYVGVIVHPIEIEIGIPFEELRDRILGRLSPELRTGLNAEYDRQKALEIPSTLYEFLDKADRSTTRPVDTTTSTIQAQPADIEKGEPQSQKQGLTTIEVARRLSL